MPISKPAVAGNIPTTIEATGIAVSGPCELVAVHYFNTTAGAGRIDIYDGAATPGNRKLTLGVGAVGQSDSYCPAQPQKFRTNINVVFTTGTGVVNISSN